MAEETVSKNEVLKLGSRGLLGNIADEIEQPTTHFSEPSEQLLKHHGTYQQDDRDTRAARRRAGEDKDYRMMVRTKTPGGLMTADQYLMCDALCEKYGQRDMRITSRQGFQFHGILKGNLRALIHDLNTLQQMTTQGACGDVVRNVMCAPVVDIAPEYARLGADLLRTAAVVSTHFLAQSSSYYDLWLDDERVSIAPDGSVTFKDKEPGKPVVEPLYGATYLPRKFKIGIAVDFDNSIDVYTQDIGVIAATLDGRITGYEILVGGGLGHSHSKAETYSRLATPLTFVDEAGLLGALEAIVKVQRDHGNRAQRHLARLKYTVDRLGIDEIRRLASEHFGSPLPLPRGIVPTAQPDYLGWHRQAQAGLNYVGVWIENGRIKDFDNGARFRTGVSAIVERFRPSVRLTPHHNMVFANIKDADVAAVSAILAEHGMPTDKGVPPLRRSEMACPALPLCGLALSEAERALPGILEEVAKAGHADADVMIRMTGCPNSCARPETAEIGIIGRGPNKYNLYVGGDRLGTRKNTTLFDNITTQELTARMAEVLTLWKAERRPDELFGDWSHRVGVADLARRMTASS